MIKGIRQKTQICVNVIIVKQQLKLRATFYIVQPIQNLREEKDK